MNKSALIIPLLAFVMLLPVSTFGRAHASTNNSANTSSFNLSSQKWKNRVLLVFAPSSSHPAYQQQMQLFDKYKSSFHERDLVLVQVVANGKSFANTEQIDPAAAAGLRDCLKVSNQDFCVVLVGKDGGVKRRDTTPIQAKAIFNEIDAMPMRRQEMRERGR